MRTLFSVNQLFISFLVFIFLLLKQLFTLKCGVSAINPDKFTMNNLTIGVIQWAKLDDFHDVVLIANDGIECMKDVREVLF